MDISIIDIWKGLHDFATSSKTYVALKGLSLLMNRLRMSQSGLGGPGIDDPDRFAVNSPRLVQLARRLGLTDADALVEAYLFHRNAVRAAFDRHLR